jgi:hypothetical protein
MMKTTTIPEDDEDIDDDDARILVELHGDSLRAIERHLNVLARMDAMRCDGLSLLRLYSGSTQALLRLYSGSTQALLRLYSGSPQALLRLYSGSTQALLRLYSGSTQALLGLLPSSSSSNAKSWPAGMRGWLVANELLRPGSYWGAFYSENFLN